MIKNMQNQETLKVSNHQLINMIPYIIIIATVLAAWFPVLGGGPLIGDEHVFTLIFKDGVFAYFSSWFSSWGTMRLLGQAINGFNTTHPTFCYFLLVFTHIFTVCLFFRVSQILLKRTSLSLVLALIMGLFPWGYQSVVQIMGYTTMLSTTLFLGNLLLILNFAKNAKSQPYIFIISYLLTFITQLIYENLVFAFMLSGVVIWLEQYQNRFRWKSIVQNIQTRVSGLAPFLGGLTFLILSKLTVNLSNVNKTLGRSLTINPEAVFSTYYYQYTNIYIFQPWLNSDTRNLIFFAWNWINIIAFILLLSIFIVSLFIYFKQKSQFLEDHKNLSSQLFVYLLSLMLGGSFIFVVAGGYTLDTRKKYALIPLMLLAFGWIWCNLFEHRFKISRKFIVILMTLGLFGVSTTWVVVGTYRYEVMRQDALAAFLATNNIVGDIQLKHNPDIEAAWPTMASTVGFSIFDDWAINIALRAKRNRLCCKTLIDMNWILQDPYAVHTTANSNAPKLSFDSNKFRWQLVDSQVKK
ncbi:hypothetical protein [Fischerella sp. JS2]|uniref:hypothetical protein n=1 Tax=Fischerella sp. JS2 TaxID=2597771 RepID=UPI0028E62CA3|nr:hypothetical protein [Fischerella sp. JS2]